MKTYEAFRAFALVLLGSLSLSGCAELPTSPLEGPRPQAARGGTPGKPTDGGGGGGGDEVPCTSGVGSVAGYLDPFTCFDSTWWLKGAHSLGRGYLDPNNVQVTEGQLRLIQPRRSYDGGEIWASSKTGFGRYEASMRASPAPGTISSLFLYGEKPAGAYSATAFYVFDEIDIELLQRDGQWYAVFATWLEGDSNGDPLWQHWEPLTYDPSAEFHTYAIEYARGSVTFSIDGQEIVTPPSDVVPTSDMYLMANAWWPTWLEGKRSRKTVYATYDWIAFTPAGATGLGGESNGRGRGSGL